MAETLHAGVDMLDGFSLMPVLLQPHSRGSVRLRGPSPADRPLIDPGYLSDPRDVKVFIEGQSMKAAAAILVLGRGADLVLGLGGTDQGKN